MLPLLEGNARGLNRLSQVKLNIIINGFVFVIDFAIILIMLLFDMSVCLIIKLMGKLATWQHQATTANHTKKQWLALMALIFSPSPYVRMTFGYRFE